MARKIPSYLKVHVEETMNPPRPNLCETALMPALCESFRKATGWSLRYLDAEDRAPEAVWLERLSNIEFESGGVLALESPESMYDADEVATAVQANQWDAVEDLATAVGGLLQELERTRTELWKREAELAAGVPVVPREDEQDHLASRLEAVLRAGAGAVGCQAAAAYLLDDATRNLKLRSCWGLPKSRFVDAARPLRGSVADLEALVGHAVVLEDAQLLAHWRIPEEFRSAVCVPISSPSIPYGTLWMFCDETRGFSETETNLIEIVAGRVAADLEREMLLQQAYTNHKLSRQLLHATQWQTSRLPQIKPMLDGWDIAGWTSQADTLGGDFHDWFVLPDGNLAFAVADAEGSLIEAGLTAASVHSAIKAHAGYRHTATEMVQRLNETLWTASAGDQFASLMYGMIQPATGELTYAAAGHLRAVAIGEATTKLIREEVSPLGTLPDFEFEELRHTIGRGELVVAVSEGVVQLLQGPGGRSQLHTLWDRARKLRSQGADEIVRRLAEYLQTRRNEPPRHDLTVLVLKRD